MTPWAQQQMADWAKKQAMSDALIRAKAQQQAQMQAYQNQQQAQQMAAYGSGVLGSIGTAASSVQNNVWTTVNTASTTTATTFNFNSLVSGASFAAVQQPQWQIDESDLDQLAEQRLKELLGKRRQLLLQHQRISLLPKLNFIRADQPVMATDLRTVEGYTLPTGKEYVLPDGALLVLDERGNYGIQDDNAKVVYRANRIREFNPYLNASDLLVSFIKEVGHLDGVNQDEILRLPVEAFINWLVLQAATKDGDATDHLPKVEDALKPKALAAPVPKTSEILNAVELE